MKPEKKQEHDAQLRHSQKLEAIGTLVSGVAHEINNPLTGILGYAELIKGRVQDPQLQEYAQGIIKEGNRVASLVRNLLSFTRGGGEDASATIIKDIIDSSLTLLTPGFRRDQITVRRYISEWIPPVLCRSQELQQVLINLLTNARHALNQRYPGYHDDKIIRIMAGSFEENGVRWLRITVEDQGIGMEPGTMERIFEPFFTTKSCTEGTGLGLTVSHGIVREHGGQLRVESEPGEYTRFHVELPVDGRPKGGLVTSSGNGGELRAPRGGSHGLGFRADSYRDYCME